MKADCNAVPVSVITSFAYLRIDSSSNIQNQENLRPDKWLFQTVNEETKKQIVSLLVEDQDYFQRTRNRFIEYRMREILKQQKINLTSNNCNDEIDRLVLEKIKIISEKYCVSCDAPNDLTFRVCRNCGDNLTKRKSSSSNIPDPYSHFNIEENPNKIKIMVGEPELINPSGFENISQILRNLGRKLGIQKYNENGNRQ